MEATKLQNHYVSQYLTLKDTTQLANLTVIYDFEPPIRINMTRSNHTTNRFRMYQGDKMKCDLM